MFTAIVSIKLNGNLAANIKIGNYKTIKGALAAMDRWTKQSLNDTTTDCSIYGLVWNGNKLETNIALW